MSHFNYTKKRTVIILLITAIISTVTGCATVINGQNQPVSVSSSSAIGASCSLENNRGKWYINNTPGSVMIHRSYNDLHITCHKKGYKPIEKTIASTTSVWTFGNLIFFPLGTLIGGSIDVVDGAAYNYPSDIRLDS
jgi:hypothetical protein